MAKKKTQTDARMQPAQTSKAGEKAGSKTASRKHPGRSGRSAGQRRVKMGDAMRGLGLDELKLAETFSSLLDRVDKPKKEKMLLEVLRECGKLLEVYPSASRSAGGSDPVPVQLVHSVPRPERPAAATADQAPLQPDMPS